MDAPKVGDVIYIQTAMSFSHGWDDIVGGKAIITEVKLVMSGGKEKLFITCGKVSGRSYNYSYLIEQQDELKAKFGDKEAYLDPDYSDYGDADWK